MWTIGMLERYISQEVKNPEKKEQLSREIANIRSQTVGRVKLVERLDAEDAFERANAKDLYEDLDSRTSEFMEADEFMALAENNVDNNSYEEFSDALRMENYPPIVSLEDLTDTEKDIQRIGYVCVREYSEDTPKYTFNGDIRNIANFGHCTQLTFYGSHEVQTSPIKFEIKAKKRLWVMQNKKPVN